MKHWFYLYAMLWILFTAVSLVMITWQHELTHVIIFRNYGYNATAELTWFGGMTLLDDGQTISESDRRDIGLFNAINELVTYQYVVMFIYVLGSYIMLLGAIDKYSEKREALQNVY